MENYRTSSTINSGGPTAEMQANAIHTPALDGWYDFVADFEDELDDGKATFSRREVAAVQQTVEEEYSTYVMGAPSSGTTLDTLKFWQVSAHKTVAVKIDILIPLDS